MKIQKAEWVLASDVPEPTLEGRAEHESAYRRGFVHGVVSAHDLARTRRGGWARWIDRLMKWRYSDTTKMTPPPTP